MITQLIRKSTALMLTIFMVSALANDINQPLPSLSWQKTQLEGLIVKKVEKTLDRVLQKNEYTVDVSIEVGDPENPEWNKSDDPMKKGGENGRSTASTETQKEEAAKQEKEKKELAEKEEEKEKEKEKKAAAVDASKIRFDDQELPDRPEDFVVFNKFGLEAPLVDDFNDLQPDGKIVLSMNDGSGGGRNPASTQLENDLEEVEEERDTLQSQLEVAIAQARKAKEDAKNSRSPTSTIEKMWKYNKAIDIYENLAKVDILVRISESLSE